MSLRKLKQKSLNFLVLLALISCSTDGTRQIQDTPYRTSGVEQYFLPELPGWINSSASGKCFKSNSFQYMDFAKINGTYQLSYRELIELQGQYNQRREDYFRSTTYRFLKPMEEASFFSNTLEQVRGGVRAFRLPDYPEVDLIWLEGYLQSEKIEELKKMAAARLFEERPPILFSTCLSQQRLSQWVAENNLENVGFYLLSAEWLSPYGSDLTLKAGLRLELRYLINDKVKVNLRLPQNSFPPSELIL